MKKTALLTVIALTVAAIVNAQTRVEIKSAELPKAITENITKDFSGFAIQNAYKVNTNNQSTYELIVAKGTEKEKLEYNSSGAFVKKSPLAHMTAQNVPAKKTQSQAHHKTQSKPQAQAQQQSKPLPQPQTKK